MPILFLVVFGILQYGLYFNDSLSTRQGVRESARQGVVGANFENSDNSDICDGATTQMDHLRCETKEQIGALTGETYVKVVKPLVWKQAQPLTVCAMVKSDGAVGLLPMPQDGWITSTTQMSIEQAEEPTGSTTWDPLPPGVSYPC